MNLARAKLAAFLNKKSWHTGGMPMQAEVWKREQEKAHEARKVEEMKREIAEERKMQELAKESEDESEMLRLELAQGRSESDRGKVKAGPGEPPEEAKVEAKLEGDEDNPFNTPPAP